MSQARESLALRRRQLVIRSTQVREQLVVQSTALLPLLAVGDRVRAETLLDESVIHLQRGRDFTVRRQGGTPSVFTREEVTNAIHKLDANLNPEWQSDIQQPPGRESERPEDGPSSPRQE